MPSLHEINQALKNKTVTKAMEQEAKDVFFSHLLNCHNCGLMPSREDDRVCQHGALAYEKARLLEVI